MGHADSGRNESAFKCRVSSLFEVSYPDPVKGQTTGTFYVGDRTAPSYTFTEKFKPWSGAKFNLVER